MDHDMIEWHNATLERVAVALERIADRLDAQAIAEEKKREEAEVLAERIAEAEARRSKPWGGKP